MMPTDRCTVVLADDHAVVRSGIRRLLEDAKMQVVAEAGDAASALRSVRGHKPEILVLDVGMPGEPSIVTIPAILVASPRTRVVVLTMEKTTASARDALRAGAHGYLSKDATAEELIAAITTVRAGGTYLHPTLGARLAAEPDPSMARPDGLTEREAEVLRLLVLGHTNAEIGEQLFLSVRTVESHRTHIQAKTSRRTRAELVRYAIDHDLLGESLRPI